MSKEFDYLLKSKLDTLNVAPDVTFDCDRVWNKIESKSKGSSGKSWYLSIGLLILLLTSVFYYFNTKSQQSEKQIDAIVMPVKLDLPIDAVDVLDAKEIENIKSSSSKNKTIIEERKIVPIVNRDTSKLTIKSSSQIINPRQIENTTSYENSKAHFRYEEKKVVKVHVYRPKKLIGFGWVFNLKANGKIITKVKNGAYEVLDMEPGQTRFSIKQQKVNIDLEVGKTYYLRASLINRIPIGKPFLEEVEEDFVKSEFESDK